MNSNVIDLHCDALLKLWENPARSFTSSKEIQANYERLKKGGVKVQIFALFPEAYLKNEQKFQAIEKQRLLFEKMLIDHPNMKHIKKWEDIFLLSKGEIGAILSLEGMEPIGDDVNRYKYLLDKGVLSVGMTWNFANLCADGVLEPRGAGLSKLGKEIVEINNKNNVLTDVSHLNEKGFWEVMELASYPIATHSNAKAIADHPRNLTDTQIKALIKKQTVIGIVFYPLFITGTNKGKLVDLLKHIDHICSLGGENHISFGSDFDGIPVTLPELEHAGCYPYLLEELLKYYKEETVIGFASANFTNVIKSYFL